MNQDTWNDEKTIIETAINLSIELHYENTVEAAQADSSLLTKTVPRYTLRAGPVPDTGLYGSAHGHHSGTMYSVTTGNETVASFTKWDNDEPHVLALGARRKKGEAHYDVFEKVSTLLRHAGFQIRDR